ncbi:MAG: sugar ABC transporter substrate-binding protein [Candidatus Cloacimonetes bacterium HGW-Cloacimonetes-1]|jgi:ribose transport system substrate-binding protein|nr:MAG: sugar ABC transporter substrate-binding protein [Candidatus Cloacimonetes bacterium HGW-Cloacimonetes-1]
MRRTLFVLFLTILFLSLTSCKTTKKANSGDATPKKYNIALVMKTLTNPFFVTMEKGARRAEKDFDIHLVVKAGARETSIEQQIGIVEQLTMDRVDAIVIAPAGSSELVAVLKKAQDSGIKIVNIDNRLDEAESQRLGLTNVPFISVDNEEGAYLAVQYICKDVKSATSAVIIEGIPTAGNAEDRKAGAQRAFKENPYVRIVASETANWKIDEAYEVCSKIFRQYRDVKLLFCANDMMALGAMQYLKDKNIKGVKVAGFDNLDEVKPFLAEGYMDVTIDQQAEEQGYIGVEYAVKLLKGETVDSKLVIPVKVITP